MSKIINQKWVKSKILCIKETFFFFWSLPINPWASFVTWLHLEAPLENIEKINKYQFSNIELVLIHTILELGVLVIAKKLSVTSITFYKKTQFLKNIYYLWPIQNPIDLI